MKKSVAIFILILSIFFAAADLRAQQGFVTVQNHQFFLNGKPYYYTGANYWYAGLLALQPDDQRGIRCLKQELDFLKSNGVSNLRVLGAVEGSGQIQAVQRVQPALQPLNGQFDTTVIRAMDLLLAEMAKRDMKAVIYLSNNWEWSGGFLQYLNWNGKLADSSLHKKLSWDALRDEVSGFYSCMPCIDGYLKQVAQLVNRVNTVSGRKYSDDPAIMGWELANEPRPMRAAADRAYLDWIKQASGFIRRLDANHLITTGSEGEMGTESMDLFRETHALPDVDYLTIHIWPKNWGWFQPATMKENLPVVLDRTLSYIGRHDSIARLLNKPLVIEEFGLPRDGHSFDPTSTTVLRDSYFKAIFELLEKNARTNGVIGGLNFWSFAGLARPIPGQTFWKEGDDYTGDPPMEEQGLNSVFDRDKSTWNIIKKTKTKAGTKP